MNRLQRSRFYYENAIYWHLFKIIAGVWLCALAICVAILALHDRGIYLTNFVN